MTKKKRPEFSTAVKREVVRRSRNRCERCGIDFDDDFKGEFHHIKSVVFKGDKDIDNCSLLCCDCHRVAPNIKNEEDFILYNYYFLRFASFKEAAQYYNVGTRMELYAEIANDLAKNHYK